MRCDDDVRRRHCLNSRFCARCYARAHWVVCPCARARGVGTALRSPPARKLSSSPLPSLHSNGSLSGSPLPSSQVSASFSSSPTSSSFCTCEESYSRKTPPPTPIPRRSPTANAPERSALKRAGISADYRRKSPAQRWSNEVMRWVGEGRPNVSTLGGLRKDHCGVMDGLCQDATCIMNIEA